MKNRPLPPSFGFARFTSSLSVAAVLGASSLFAASDTWTGAADGAWSNAGNWLGGAAPGATTGSANTDTATFLDGGSGNTAVTVDAGRNLRYLSFDTASVGSYTFGGSSLQLNGGTNSSISKITISATVADGVTQTFNNAISLNGNSRFDNLSTGSARFVFAGNISAASNTTLTLTTSSTGSPSGVNLFSGALGDGAGVLSVAIGEFSSGTGVGKVEFTGANTYSGTTTINFAQGKSVGTGEFIASGTNSSNGATTVQHGTLTLNNASNGGIAGGVLTLFGGGFLRANTSTAGTLSNEIQQTNSFTLAGSNNLVFNGAFINKTASSRPLTNSITSGSKLTINGDVYLSDASATSRTWQLRGSGETVINGDVSDFSGGRGSVASHLDFATSAGGGRSLTLNGANTYSGNTILAGGAATLFTLGDTGSMTFYIGENGVNNQVNGSATATFNGGFVFDLSGASLVDGNSWNIVNVGTLTESFSGTFFVQGFSEIANVWSNGAGLTFSEATGVLSYAIPEPSAFALLGGAGVFAFAGLRRRKLRTASAAV